MTTHPVFYNLFSDDRILHAVATAFGGDTGTLDSRRFPDGESYLNVVDNVKDKHVIILCALDHPNDKFLPLWFLANTLRELGAVKIGLLIPYLPYMRQDCRFNSGEAVTSRYFSRLISELADWMVTIDPHLHRYAALSEIYTIPCDTLHADVILAQWIKGLGTDTLLVGPDRESEQWVAGVAHQINSPYVVADKKRFGDRNVSISLPDIAAYSHCTPVIIDDIISSGETLIQITKILQKSNQRPIHCAAIHGIFAGDAYERLVKLGINLATGNSIRHPSNQFDLTPLLIEGVARHLSFPSPLR